MGIEITGWGKCTPSAVLTNSDLETILDTDDEWITTRTGVKQRRIAEAPLSEIGTIAAKHALAAADKDPNEIDAVMMATCTPEFLIPSTASRVQMNIGNNTAAAFDFNSACSGFVYGLTTAYSMIHSGIFNNVLLVGGEKVSYFLDWTARDTAVLFGDGAGAAVISATNKNEGVLSTHLHSEGKFAEELALIKPATTFWIDKIIEDENEDGSGYSPVMNGNFVFKNAVIRFEEVIFEALNYSNLKPEDISLLIPHQANLRISQFIQKRLGLDDDQVFNNSIRHSEKYDSSKIIERNQRIIKKYQSLVRSAIALDALLESEQYEISDVKIS